MKYNPYKGYHHIPYHVWPCPRRVRTKGDWRLNYPGPGDIKYAHHWHVVSRRMSDWVDDCPHCKWSHCRMCGCPTFWKRYGRHESNDSRYQKVLVHRQFRRHVNFAIWRELKGDDDVSHAFYEPGDWLD